MEDFSRQLEVFDPRQFNTPVHVIGCGAGGSWTAMMLAKLGVKDLTLWDFDTVGQHNLPNQLYKETDVGLLKSAQAARNCEDFSGTLPAYNTTAVDGDTQLSGIVFMEVDSMKARKEIFEKACKNHLDIPLVVESRANVSGGRVYAFNPSSKLECEAYAETLYSDEEAQASMCGVVLSMAPTSALISSLAVWQLVKWRNHWDIENEIIIDARSNTFLSRRF